MATIHCSSGEAFNETRTKLALGNNCTDQTETRRVCKYEIPKFVPLPWSNCVTYHMSLV